MKPHVLPNPPVGCRRTDRIFCRAVKNAKWRYRRSNIYPASGGHIWYDGVGYWAALDFDDPNAPGLRYLGKGPTGVAWYCLPQTAASKRCHGSNAVRTAPPCPPTGAVLGFTVKGYPA